MNYRMLEREKKKKRKEKKRKGKEKERTADLLPFRHRISGFCCSALSAHTKRVGRVYRGYSLVRNRRIEIENRTPSRSLRFDLLRYKSRKIFV